MAKSQFIYGKDRLQPTMTSGDFPLPPTPPTPRKKGGVRYIAANPEISTLNIPQGEFEQQILDLEATLDQMMAFNGNSPTLLNPHRYRSWREQLHRHIVWLRAQLVTEQLVDQP